MFCWYCGGNASEPDHADHCDGRQGHREAAFNLPLARAKRDEALEQVEAHAAETFIDLAVLAIDRVARCRPAFIVDEVWKELGETAPTHEKRAMGAAMQLARRHGLITPTETFIASAQVQCHANPRRVWQSLVYRASR